MCHQTYPVYSEWGWRGGVSEHGQGEVDSELGIKNDANIGDNKAQDSMEAASSL